MIINTKGCVLAGVRLMSSTQTWRISIDLPEGIDLADINALLRKSLTLNLVSDDIMDKMKKQIDDN